MTLVGKLWGRPGAMTLMTLTNNPVFGAVGACILLCTCRGLGSIQRFGIQALPAYASETGVHCVHKSANWSLHLKPDVHY